MNPIYKFELTAGNTTQRAFPVYNGDLTKDFEKESGQEFFRAKLSGKLTFESDDYTFIVSQSFDTQFVFEIFISYNAGQSWTSYWRGTFWKTDCEFDGDAQTVVVQPTVLDQYNDILAGLDKEYNLIDLAPEIVPVKADKRPMIQVYVPGQSVVGCFLSGMWWEQEATPEGDETKLVNDFHFALNKVMTVVDVSGTVSPVLPDFFAKTSVGTERFSLTTQGTTDFVGTNYTLRYYFLAGTGGATQQWQILRNSDSVVLWEKSTSGGTAPDTSIPQNVVLSPVSGTGATGDVSLFIHDIPVYSRYVCDTQEINGLQTYEILVDDIVENNRNYHRAIGYYFPDTIYFSSVLTSTPNKWGLYQPGQYYQQPYLIYHAEFFPVARNGWGRISVWFTFSLFDWYVEESGREPFTIRHAYPIWSVISVLLSQIAPGITHDGTTDYSQFLYGENLIGITQTLLITPKSNIVSAGYDQPAQKAPITLKNVLDMLRDCFRCYWFIDEQNRFRVEHIQYFRNGGSYSGSPVVGIDLTTQQVSRNGKAWAFARDQFKFDKPAMAARYQFGWMDDVTQLFEGYPIDIISKYVNPDNIEQIDVSRFTSDIDYILLNPGAVSKDGFVLLSAVNSEIRNWQELIDTPLTFTFSGQIATGLAISAYRGKTMQITVKSTNNFFVVYQTGVNFAQVIGTVLDQPGVNKTFEFTVDERADKIELYHYADVSGTAIISSLKVDMSTEDVGLALPYYNYIISGVDHYLQNAFVAFCILQDYYAFDMPAPLYSINGQQRQARGVKKLKNQEMRFPVLNDPNLFQLVKTNLGNGTIEKLSVNLSSRNAKTTLKYDTE